MAEKAKGQYRLPDNLTLQHAVKLSISEDKPILLDYWTNSIDKKALIGVTDTNEKYLIKSEEEYTSCIANLFQIGKDLIVATENSIYIVDLAIDRKKITQLRREKKE
jgi:hypothetical protein